MTSHAVKDLFLTTGIETELLGKVFFYNIKNFVKIWNLSAKHKKKTLDQESFFIALKLVAILQSGKTLEEAHSECKLGTFFFI